MTHLLSSPSVSPIPLPLRRLLSAAAPAVPPSPNFAVEEYLVENCGLSRPQALKSSSKLRHLKSPANPDAVLAFLAGLGLSGAAVAKDPLLLCASVEKTLGPVVAGLTGHGLSRAEIASVVSLGRAIFRCRSALSVLGSTGDLVRFLKRSTYLLGCSLDKVVKPNVALLRGCGLADRDISKLCLSASPVLTIVEKVFVEKYIRPYKEAAPRLAQDYAAACRGEVPSNFRFA